MRVSIISRACKQHWTVSLRNLDCQRGPVILRSVYWVEVFTVRLFSPWLRFLSEWFIFPQHIHGLLVGLGFPPSGRLCESGLSWDYKDVLGTLLGIDCKPELARRCLWLSSTLAHLCSLMINNAGVSAWGC